MKPENLNRINSPEAHRQLPLSPSILERLGQLQNTPVGGVVETRISHKAGEKRSQKLPKCVLHMNSSSFKHDPSENRLYTRTIQI